MRTSVAVVSLKPFWRYYGGKYRAAPRYPKPQHKTIIEPFAGAAGYACRYPDHNVVLVEKFPVIAEIWRYLITVPASEVLRIPANPQHVDELPAWVPEGAKYLVGWWMNAATVTPCKQLSAGLRRMGTVGGYDEYVRRFGGWTEATRLRVASQVERIRHWKIIEGDYHEAPHVKATWFVDPPYNNKAGSYYPHGPSAIDYHELGCWCVDRIGQVIVCENEGATWLPFKPFATLKPGVNGKGSREVIWAST